MVIDDGVARHQVEKLQKVREKRDSARVQRSLEALGSAATTDANLMPYILECVRAYATVGEMCDVMRKIFGTYEEPAFRVSPGIVGRVRSGHQDLADN